MIMMKLRLFISFIKVTNTKAAARIITLNTWYIVLVIAALTFFY